jgi:hypothetical protein
MIAKSMDVFSLRDTVVGEYKKPATSFTTVFAEDIRRQVDAVYAEGRFWPEPVIQINPSDRRGADIEALAGGGALDPRTAKGLNLRDEVGRYWRIAQAHLNEPAAGRSRDTDPRALAGRELLDHAGRVTAVAAKAKAEAEHDRYRALQDAAPRAIDAAFDRAVKQIPKPSTDRKKRRRKK